MKLKVYSLVAALFIAGFLIFQWNATHFHLGHWLQVHTGTVNEVSPYYGFFSGFGSDLGEYAIVWSVCGGIALTARKHNCHHDGCPWIGRYEIADGHYRVCRKHHPDPAVRDKHVDMTHLIHAHQKHLESKGITQ